LHATRFGPLQLAKPAEILAAQRIDFGHPERFAT